MSAASRAKSGKSNGNAYVGRADAGPKHVAGTCIPLNVSVGD